MDTLPRRGLLALLGAGTLSGCLGETAPFGDETSIPNTLPLDGCDDPTAWPTFQGTPQRAGHSEVSLRTEPTLIEHGGAPESLSGTGLTVATDEYVCWHQERGTTVYRTDRSTGRTASLQLDRAARVSPVTACGLLGVHTNAGLTWIDIDGWEVVERTSTASPHAGTLVDETLAYVPALGGGLQSYSTETGEREWSVETDRLVTGLSSTPETAVVVDSNSEGGAVVAVEKSTGEQRWRTDVVGETYTHPVVGSEIFVRDNDGTLHALDKESGDRLWTAESDTTGLYTVPAVREGTVFLPDEPSGSVTALATETGERLWRTQIPTGDGRDDPSATLTAPVCTPDSVVVGASPGGLIALNRETGAVRWQNTSHSFGSSLVAVGDSLYGLVTSGVVEAAPG
jgi:outer membrane protein assembly factor BamB